LAVVSVKEKAVLSRISVNGEAEMEEIVPS
jgi:hypothetical protein